MVLDFPHVSEQAWTACALWTARAQRDPTSRRADSSPKRPPKGQGSSVITYHSLLTYRPVVRSPSIEDIRRTAQGTLSGRSPDSRRVLSLNRDSAGGLPYRPAGVDNKRQVDPTSRRADSPSREGGGGPAYRASGVGRKPRRPRKSEPRWCWFFHVSPSRLGQHAPRRQQEPKETQLLDVPTAA